MKEDICDFCKGIGSISSNICVYCNGIGEWNQVLKNYKNSKNMMKASKGRQMQGTLRRMGFG